MAAESKPFLTARWESLLLLNYPCPSDLLAPLVPAGTELDPWHDENMVSLVGFMFRGTRVRGIPFPGHRTFEEVNLRFYVRRLSADGSIRRAVVFIRELVPRWIIATIARALYNEPYLAVPMTHDIRLDAGTGGSVAYGWRLGNAPFRMEGAVEGPAKDLVAESEAVFITEHDWGYTRQRDGGTLEYRVDHPPWQVWHAREARFDGPSEGLYGSAFAEILAQPPRSGFVAIGSEVEVYPGRRIVCG